MTDSHSIRFKTLLRVLTLLTALSVILPLQAQQSQQSQQAEQELLTINMRDADIGAVIQWIAEQTNKKIVVDPRVKGKVTVLANQAMNAEQAYQVFLTTLDVYGYAASESGGILRIYPAALNKNAPRDLIANFDQLGGGEQIIYIFQARQVSAIKLVELLKPLLPATGHIAAYPESNSLIIADESANVKRLVTMVKQIDQTGDFDIEVIKLNHADARNVVGLVLSLTQSAASPSFSITSDERSNSLLMTGDPATRNRVSQLIKQLDKPITDSGNTRVVYLHYLDAAELLPILRGMATAMAEDNKNAEANSSISIEASESSNALIMTAPPYILEMMADVIAQVDIRRAQVLVEAIIVEVSKDFSQTLGVEWNTSLNRDDGVEAITNFGLKSADEDGVLSLIGSGLNLGFYRNGSLRALVQAVANENDANILSTPSIMTLDNQEAEILVGSNVPLITGQSTGSSSSTNDPFTTIEREDIGLSLKITPQINSGDAITLDVLQEIETISETSANTNDIVTNKRSIKTKVIVEDDNILVLGGLISDDVQQIVSKVPILGDMPLLGALFRTTTDKVIKKNLMVFIHPVILDSDEVAIELSQKNYNLMQDLQKKYNSGDFSAEDVNLSDFIEYTPRNKQ
ncbi:MAG: type II secretion system secretin GspD [Oceanicoccus sp.]|uniref:type II secretion system secretin GspD n=1 Tax=Oceanicoccus sp. TaxID=2691044 RepID=UPI002629C1F6|nr:type II secretion system secretin GspD [Oceanicoccus sp.]MDG1773306.1 type II secretion system secretin GspD [Oceanicoccus sp.]